MILGWWLINAMPAVYNICMDKDRYKITDKETFNRDKDIEVSYYVYQDLGWSIATEHMLLMGKLFGRMRARIAKWMCPYVWSDVESLVQYVDSREFVRDAKTVQYYENAWTESKID